MLAGLFEMGTLRIPPGFWALAVAEPASAIIISPLATAARNRGPIFAPSLSLLSRAALAAFLIYPISPLTWGRRQVPPRGRKMNGWASGLAVALASHLHRTRTATFGTGTNWPFSTKAGRSVGIRQLPLWSISHCRGRLQRATASGRMNEPARAGGSARHGWWVFDRVMRGSA